MKLKVLFNQLHEIISFRAYDRLRLQQNVEAWLMPWEIEKPVALPWGEWEDFDTKQKTKYPIRWFLFDTIPAWFGHVAFHWRLRRWAIKHKYIPKHKHHIIRTSLEPGYYDPDIQILYATMDLVKEFVEKTEHTIDWAENDKHTEVWRELQVVYKWWTDKYPYREKELPDFPDVDFRWIVGRDKEKYVDNPEVKEWRRIADIHSKMEEEWVREEEEMLMRVMKVRKFLWYP